MSRLESIRRISPFGFAGRLIRLPLRLVPRNAVVPVLTGINRGMRWIAGASSTNSSWIGIYEFDHMAALQKLVKPGMVVYDIGANAGYYTLAFSRLVGDSGRVFAFEPEARNAYLIRRHIRMNGLQNVTFIQAAVSNTTGMVGFEGAMEKGKIVAGSAYQVPAISLDDFIAAGNPQPSFIKMDIEGAERLALDGTRSILSLRQAAWLLATHSAQLRTDCREVFLRSGYTFRGLDLQNDPGQSMDFLALPEPAAA